MCTIVWIFDSLPHLVALNKAIWRPSIFLAQCDSVCFGRPSTTQGRRFHGAATG